MLLLFNKIITAAKAIHQTAACLEFPSPSDSSAIRFAPSGANSVPITNNPTLMSLIFWYLAVFQFIRSAITRKYIANFFSTAAKGKMSLCPHCEPFCCTVCKKTFCYNCREFDLVKCARRHSVVSAKTASTAKCATSRPVVSVKIWSSVTSATRHAATTANIIPTVKSARSHSASSATNTAKCARRHSVVNAKTLSTVKSATSRPVLTAEIGSSVASATRQPATTANMIPTVKSARRNPASSAKNTANCATRHSAVSANTLSTVNGVIIPSVLSATKICSSVTSATRQSATSARVCASVPIATRHCAQTAKSSTAVKCAPSHSATTAKSATAPKSARRYSAVNAKTIYAVKSVRIARIPSFLSARKICSSVTSVTRHSAALAFGSNVVSATSCPVRTATIISPAKSVINHSALIANLPSIAVDARIPSVLVAESRSLVTMNASISFATSSAKKCMLVVVRKAKGFLPKRPKYLPRGKTDSQRLGT
jgi:hypothetical protein